MSFGVHPFILIAAVGVLVAWLAIAMAFGAKRRFVAAMWALLALVALAPAACVFLALHPEWVDGRFDTYKRFHRDIRVGMTREQVLAALEQRYPSHGPRQRPRIFQDTPEVLGFFMDPETSREPNCEGILLTLEAGRVTRIVYSPD